MGHHATALLLFAVLSMAFVTGCIDLPKKEAVQATDGEGWVNRDVDSIDISDRYVVYSRMIRDGDSNSIDNRDGVFVLDLKKGQETRIGEGLHRVRISGTIAVWEDGGGNIIVHDIANGSTVPMNASGIVGRPDISGDRIVWTAERRALGEGDIARGMDLIMVDLGDGHMTRLTNTTNDKGPPSIQGDRVVWVDTGTSGAQIALLDIGRTNVTQTSLTRWAVLPTLPEIWGDIVVWIDHRPSPALQCSDVYGYDLVRSEEFPISDTCGAVDMDIFGDLVVWEDVSRENNAWESGDIMMYDMSANRTTVLTQDRMSQWCPAVNEDVVVWGDDRASKGDIFVHQLRTPKMFGIDVYIVYVLIGAGIITLCALGLHAVSQRRPRPPPATVKEEMEREREKEKGKGKEGKRPVSTDKSMETEILNGKPPKAR